VNSDTPYWDQSHRDLRERVHRWADANLFASGASSADLEGRARRLVRDLGSEGFLRCCVPQPFGGARVGIQTRDLCIARQELARASALADTMFAIQALGSYPVTLAGSEAQKRRLLPAVARGEAIAAFALTEEEAGSDAAALQTTALRRGDAYYLNGAKRFVSNAGIADYYVVFASTDAENKAKAISAFLVAAGAPGLKLGERTQMLSPHPIGELEFVDCLVPLDALLGVEGRGLEIAFATLDLLRCTVGAAAVGFAQRALEEALRYSRSRRQFGRPIVEFQAVAFKLAEMATELEAARLLVYRAAWARDRGADELKKHASMAKLYATETAQRIVDQALQIHGGAGLIAGSIMERLYRDVRALRIYEGTSEIQKVIIARELLKKPEA